MNTQPTDFQDTIAEGEATDPVVAKLTDAMTPGAQIDFDPAEAEQAGAFQEQALSLADAEAATDDGAELEA
ncbi:MAG: hypothetical protein ACKO1H_10765 [Tabrizicola sp.]